MYFMRTTVDLPDPVFRQIKSLAALRGITLREFILSAVEQSLRSKPAVEEYQVELPVIPSKRPGTLSLTNAEIEDLLT